MITYLIARAQRALERWGRVVHMLDGGAWGVLGAKFLLDQLSKRRLSSMLRRERAGSRAWTVLPRRGGIRMMSLDDDSVAWCLGELKVYGL